MIGILYDGDKEMENLIPPAKDRLDSIIKKGRIDLYKPIQIAEVLHHSRTIGDINILDVESYKNPSIHWRDDVTIRLTGKKSTSSAHYQHNIWNDNAMPPNILEILDNENKKTNGAVEKYIYSKVNDRLATIKNLIHYIENTSNEEFDLSELLKMFIREKGLRRSIDKAYEIVTYSLFETIVTAFQVKIKISVPKYKKELIEEFSEIAKIIIGVTPDNLYWEEPAHIYRLGVTNAADRGLDMWANFGPAIQVKHLTLNEKLAKSIVDQVESDLIIIVCQDADVKVIQIITKQIGWGKRVRGIIKESQLIEWYDKCLRGKFKDELAEPLMERLIEGFYQEFPQAAEIMTFMLERGYNNIIASGIWRN